MASTPIYNWPTPDNTGLVKNGALDMRTLGNAIDTTMATMTPKSLVDAKGDLVTATANDTPARLAVGANGETLVADSSTATGLRYNPQNALVNPVINGGMDIWQRGTSGFTGVYAYCADRWQKNFATHYTVSRQTTSDTTNLPNIQYSSRLQRNSGSTSTTNAEYVTSIETINSIPYAGKTVTLSFYARAGANFSAASSLFYAGLFSGTGTDQNILTAGSFTGQATVGQSFVTLTSSWQRFVITGTIAATATELAIYTYFTPTGTAGANDWAEITGVQIDLGTYTASTAPTFRRSGGTIQQELAACQRYYWRTTGDDNFDIALGSGSGTTKVYVPVVNPVFMRVEPTSVDYANLRVGDFTNAAIDVTSLTLLTTSSSSRSVTLDVNVASGITAYRPYTLRNNSSFAGYVGLSAEL